MAASPLMLINAAEVASEIHVGLTAGAPGGIKKLADLLGWPYTTAYSHLVRVENGEQEGLPMDLVRAAHFLLGPRLDSYLIWPGQQVVPNTPLPRGLKIGPDEAERACGSCCIDSAKELEAIRLALADGKLSKTEARRLREGIRKIHQDAHQVSLVLDAFLASDGGGGGTDQEP